MNGDQSIQPWHSHFTLAVTPGQAKDLDTHGHLVPLPQATGENGEPRPARAEGTARRHLENGQIHGIFPTTYYAGHTGVAGLVEGHAKGTSGALGDAN